MGEVTLRGLVAVGRVAVLLVGLLVVVVPSPGGAQDRPPGHGGGSGEQELVVFPADWRESHPFSVRLADTGRAEHVVDLEAVRFATDSLVVQAARKTFREPDLGTFPASQVRQAFASGERDLFIVQARGPAAQVELRRWLERARVPILGYIPHEAYLVRLDPRGVSLVSALEPVFWVGLYQPAYRVAPDLDFILEADPGHQLKLRLRLDPEAYPSEDGVRAAIAEVPEAAVVEVVRARRDWIVRVDGPVTLARRFSTLAGCLWVERFVDVQLLNNVARTSSTVATGRGPVAGPIMDVEDVWSRGIRGEMQIAAAADTGLSTGDITTPDSLHFDFGQVGSATNPMRVIRGYALARSTWDDPSPLADGHGTHTSGSIVGNGILSGSTPSTDTYPAGSFAGVAPKAQLVFQSVMDATGGLLVPLDLNTLFLPPYGDGARVHSNSWGAQMNGAYDTSSQTLDEFAWDHKDMVITFAAGNYGTDSGADGVINTDSIASPGTAKNCITVGASENYRPTYVYEYPEGDCTGSAWEQASWGWFNGSLYAESPIFEDPMANNASGMVPFSSRGPADDSRYKPDIVAPGSAVVSTRTNQSQAYAQWGTCNVPLAQRTHYLSMGGTSMANPLTAGAATLVRQYYADGWHANDSDVTSGAPVPAQGFNPSSALVKATLVNGAWDMAPGQYGSVTPQPEIPPSWDRAAIPARNLPNNAEGFGRVDLEAALFPGSGWGRSASRRMHVRDVAPGLATGQRDSRSYGVGSGSDPMIVTLVWTDPFAATGSGTKLVNNLDLEVTSPSGRRYTTNKVDTFVQSPTVFVRDSRNNVEQVKVTAPETGSWTVDVVGTAVPGNAVPGTTTQPFAIVVSAVTCAVPAAPVVTATPNGNYRIDVSWTSVAGAVEYTVYRGTVAGQATTLVATIAAPATSFADTPLGGGVTYYYVVKAASGPDCQSARSAEASATAGGACTLAPEFGGLDSVVSSGTAACSLDLDWTAATDSCGGPVTYSIYRSTTAGFTPGLANRIASGLSAATLTYTDSSGLVAGTTYHYVVRATDQASGIEDANAVERSAVAGNPYLYGPQSFDTFGDLTLAGWTRGFYLGSASDWRGVMTCAARTGPKVFRFGGNNCPTPYSDAASLNQAYVRTPAIAVPAGSTGVRLSFWHRWSFEPGWDGAYLEVSLDGTNYHYVFPASVLTNGYNGSNYTFGVLQWDGDHSSAFVNTVVDLDAACDGVPGNTGGCAGKSVRVAFVTVTDYVVGYPGWFIDDVQVTRDAVGSCSVAPQPVPFLTARATSTANLIEWQNPLSGGYGSAMVRFRTGATPPTSVTDGTLLTCAGQNTALGAYNSCSHTGLTNNTAYSYSLFVDNGAGVYSARRTVSATPFATGVRKWAYSTGAANLAPAGVFPGAVGVGGVFTLSNDRALHATDPTTAGGSWPRTGAFGWTPLAMNGPAQHRPPVVPLASGLRVFLASQDGYAYAVDARTGALLWTSARLGDVLQANPAGLFSDFVATAPDRVFVGTRNATSANTLYALDPETGATLGQFDNGGGANAIGVITGIAVDYATNDVYFTSRAPAGGSPDTLWCVDGETMTRQWSLPVGDVDGSPVLHLGRIYVGTNAGEVKAIDATTRAVVWTYTCSPADGPVKGYVFPHFGVSPVRLYFSTSNRVWGIVDNGATPSLSWTTTGVPGPSVPLYVIGTTYLLVGGSNGTLYQRLTTTGGLRTSLSFGSAGLGSPARDTLNDLFHVGSTAGVLHAFSLPLP